jgi:hypothetical protein
MLGDIEEVGMTTFSSAIPISCHPVFTIGRLARQRNPSDSANAHHDGTATSNEAYLGHCRQCRAGLDLPCVI